MTKLKKQDGTSPTAAVNEQPQVTAPTPSEIVMERIKQLEQTIGNIESDLLFLRGSLNEARLLYEVFNKE